MNNIIWAFVAGIGFGVFQTLNRKAGQQLDPLRGTFILLIFSSIMMIVLAVTTTDVSVIRSSPPLAIVYFVIAGFIHFFVGWTLLSISQKQIGAARTGAAIGTLPVFGLVIDVLLYGEPITLPLLLGVALVVGGVYMISFR